MPIPKEEIERLRKLKGVEQQATPVEPVIVEEIKPVPVVTPETKPKVKKPTPSVPVQEAPVTTEAIPYVPGPVVMPVAPKPTIVEQDVSEIPGRRPSARVVQEVTPTQIENFKLAEAVQSAPIIESASMLLRDKGVQALMAEYPQGKGDAKSWVEKRARQLATQPDYQPVSDSEEDRAAATARTRGRAIDELAVLKTVGAWSSPLLLKIGREGPIQEAAAKYKAAQEANLKEYQTLLNQADVNGMTGANREAYAQALAIAQQKQNEKAKAEYDRAVGEASTDWSNAIGTQVEIVGVDKYGQPLLRQEDIVNTGIDLLSLPTYAGANLLEQNYRALGGDTQIGSKPLSFAEQVRERRDFSRFARDVVETPESTAGQVLLATTAAAADVFTPDPLTIATGGLSVVGRTALKGARATGVARALKPVLQPLESVVRVSADVDRTLRAMPSGGELDDIVKLREINPKLADELEYRISEQLRNSDVQDVADLAGKPIQDINTEIGRLPSDPRIPTMEDLIVNAKKSLLDDIDYAPILEREASKNQRIMETILKGGKKTVVSQLQDAASYIYGIVGGGRNEFEEWLKLGAGEELAPILQRISRVGEESKATVAQILDAPLVNGIKDPTVIEQRLTDFINQYDGVLPDQFLDVLRKQILMTGEDLPKTVDDVVRSLKTIEILQAEKKANPEIFTDLLNGFYTTDRKLRRELMLENGSVIPSNTERLQDAQMNWTNAVQDVKDNLAKVLNDLSQKQDAMIAKIESRIADVQRSNKSAQAIKTEIADLDAQIQKVKDRYFIRGSEAQARAADDIDNLNAVFQTDIDNIKNTPVETPPVAPTIQQRAAVRDRSARLGDAGNPIIPQAIRDMAASGAGQKALVDELKRSVFKELPYIPPVALEAALKGMPNDVPQGPATNAIKALAGLWSATNTRGMVELRPGYFLNNMLGNIEQVYIQFGLKQAVKQAIRSELGNIFPIAVGGAQEAIKAGASLGAGKLGRLAALPFTGFFGTANGAKTVEQVADTLSRAGDKLTRLLHLASNDIDTIRILNNQPGSTRFSDGRVISNRELYNEMVRGGVLDSFDTALRQDVQDMMGVFGDFVTLPAKGVDNIATALGARQRAGLYVSLIDSGMTPKQAAEGVVKSLYDYRMSMTQADQSLLTKLLFPFWRWQKNANRQLLGAFTSPQGIYRLGTWLKGRRELGELVDSFYQDYDDYGVAVKRMSREEQEDYNANVLPLLVALSEQGYTKEEINSLMFELNQSRDPERKGTPLIVTNVIDQLNIPVEDKDRMSRAVQRAAVYVDPKAWRVNQSSWGRKDAVARIRPIHDQKIYDALRSIKEDPKSSQEEKEKAESEMMQMDLMSAWTLAAPPSGMEGAATFLAAFPLLAANIISNSISDAPRIDVLPGPISMLGADKAPVPTIIGNLLTGESGNVKLSEATFDLLDYFSPNTVEYAERVVNPRTQQIQYEVTSPTLAAMMQLSPLAKLDALFQDPDKQFEMSQLPRVLKALGFRIGKVTPGGAEMEGRILQSREGKDRETMGVVPSLVQENDVAEENK